MNSGISDIGETHLVQGQEEIYDVQPWYPIPMKSNIVKWRAAKKAKANERSW